MKGEINNMRCVDLILIIVLIISFISKIIMQLILKSLYKKNNKDCEFKRPCIYLDSFFSQTSVSQRCRWSRLSKKYFLNERCQKERCPGYKTENFSIEEIMQLNRKNSFLLMFFDVLSQLSTVIILIRTLLSSFA